MKSKVATIIITILFSMLLCPGWAQQEIELRLETPPVVNTEPENESGLSKPLELPTKIEAIARGKAPAITGVYAILMDAETGQVLYEKNAFTKRPVASTTKIMTAIVALERANMSDIVVVSKNAAKVPHTSLNLKVGERIPMRDMMIGMLLRSANDAAVAIAEHVAGSVPAFAKLMNAKAKEIGAKNTHFKNPNGLYEPGHYSTAYDLALITRYALQIDEINEIVRMKKVAITRSMNHEDVVVINRSQFIKHYPGADGVKSGYTREAGNCYVGSATRNNWRLISVVLKSKNATKDTATLMDYGFSNFKRVVVVPKGKVFRSSRVIGAGSVPAVTTEGLTAAIPKEEDEKSVTLETKFRQERVPIKRGQVLGQITACLGDKPLCHTILTATRDVDRTLSGSIVYWLRNCFILLASLGLCIRYAGTAAKNSRRVRHRLAAEIRRTNHLR